MSIVKKTEDQKGNPASLKLGISQKGLYYVQGKGEEREFVDVETPFKCIILDAVNIMASPDMRKGLVYVSQEYKGIYGEPCKKFNLYAVDNEEGKREVEAEIETKDQGNVYAKKLGLRREDILYCFQPDGLGFFRLHLKGMSAGELYMARTGAGDYDFDVKNRLIIDGFYEKENPNKPGEMLSVPSISVKEPDGYDIAEIVDLAKKEGLIDYLLVNIYGEEPEPQSENPADDLPI